MALRAFWQQTNRHNQVDRIELHDSEYDEPSPELQFKGDKTGFTRQWDEITSESNDKLINIQANRIQIGKYDFRPRIENQTGFQILEDIRDSDNKRFHIVHKIDGVFEWAGWVTTRIFSYPEKDNNFFAHIRATDFEILKGQDYPLDDTRQTFITTFADLFSELPEDTPIKTATSWVEENVTDAENGTNYDFLNQIYHETKALRNFGRTGDETDQPIKKYEALERVANPGLLIKQVGGHVMIDQLTDLADPTDVNETIYDATGAVTTATQSVDRRQTGYTTTDNGTPTIKVTSNNENYPAVKRVTAKFDHRSVVSAPKLPSAVFLTGNEDRDVTNQFIPGNDQRIELSAYVFAEYDEDHSSGEAEVKIRVGQYYYNGTSWTQDNTDRVTVNLTGSGIQVETPVGEPNYYRYNGSLSIITPQIPPDAQSPLEITFYNALINASPDVVATNTAYQNISFSITNLENPDENTTSVDFQLTQQNRDYSQTITLKDSWFGDGPSQSSVSALRYSENAIADITSNSWRRRGQTIAYRRYHENLLKEVLDLSRNNVRRLEADIWGAYDPTKVLDYNGSYFYFAGGKYDGTTGKWDVTLMELKLQTGTDDFDDIPKYTDEAGSGTGSTGAGGGGTDTDTLDNRYAKQASNLSDLDDLATARDNLGVEIGTDVQAFSSALQDLADNLDVSADNLDTAYAERGSQIAGNLLNWDGSDLDVDSNLNVFANNALTSSELGQLQNIDSVTISNTQWGYLGALDQGVATTDDVEFQGLTATTGAFSSPVAFDRTRSTSSVSGNSIYAFDSSGGFAVGAGGVISDVFGYDNTNLYSALAWFHDGSDIWIGNGYSSIDLQASVTAEDATFSDFVDVSHDSFLARFQSTSNSDVAGIRIQSANSSGSVRFGDIYVDPDNEVWGFTKRLTSGSSSPIFGGTNKAIEIGSNSIDILDTLTGTTADFSSSLDADTLRTDTGKFLAPTSYQFRNAGDTGFRDVEMAGLTATTATFSGLTTHQGGIDLPATAQIEFPAVGNVDSDFLRIGESNGYGFFWRYTGSQSGSDNGLQLWREGTGPDPYQEGGIVISTDQTGNVGINKTGATEALDVNGNILSNGNVFSEDFTDATWTGNGYRGTNAGDWVVENLRVRNALEVYEFVAKQISSVGGKEILSIANGRIESVNAGANEIEVQDVRGQNATSFEAGDLWIVQVTDINNDLESSGTGSIVRSVRGSVTSVSGATLTVSVDSGSLSDLEENDLIVAYGSSNSDRNAIMYRNVDRSDDELITRVQTGVTDFSGLTSINNTKFAYGDVVDYWNDSTGESQAEVFGSFAGDINGPHILATDQDVLLRGVDLDVDSLPRVSDENLVSLFRFDENSRDTLVDSTGRNTGSYNNATIAGGISGDAFEGNGTDTYATTDFQGVAGTRYTVTGWFYVYSFNSNNVGAIFSGGSGGDANGIRIETSSFSIADAEFDVGSGSTVNQAYIDGEKVSVPYTNFTTGQWVFFALDLTIDSVNNDHWIGANNNDSNHFDGRIDELRIYSRSLSHAEVKSLYTNPSGNSGGLISANTVRTGLLESTNSNLTFDLDTGELTAQDLLINAGGTGFESADFHLDTISNKRMSLGSVFSADGGTDEGQLSSLEVFPSHIQSADNAFRLGGQGLQMDTGSSASSTQAIKWYDGGYSLSNLQHAIAPANTGLKVTKRDAGSGNLNVIAQFQDDYLNLPDGLRIQGGLLVALNLPTSDPQRQGQVWYDETNDKLTLSTPNDPVITAGENGTDEIIISLDNATTGPYDIIDASDDSVIANDVSMPYTHSGLDPDTEYCYYVTDNNGNDSNTDCATTLALSPEISCSGGTSAIQITLDTPSTSPYTLYRNGSVLETGLVDGDFPYTDNLITGTYQYQLEDTNGAFSNTTECTAT